ncbi:hypothetical protein BGZ51_000986 [Haplosporangium sp. Z 767]|nr:hypothetical protein BGZ51_000986 [Haplosporangium sp. Z 767]KAF9189742.1 hypothetical protein BGZ50_000611 [Haplosporangium sp. Z 11]
MHHQFDSSAIAQQHQQQQQQQQQFDNHHTSTGPCASLRATTTGPSAPLGQHPRPIQESGSGFIQELYRGDHHHHPPGHGQEHIQQMTENVPLAPPSPLLLNPTILASQQPPESSMSTSRHLLQEMELHPHMVHPPQQHEYSTLEQQQFQQLNSGVQFQQRAYIMQQQQLNQQHHEQRGRTDSAESGFLRKRSLSVPLLSIQQTGSNSAQRRAAATAVAQAAEQRKLQQSNRGDQDMDMDETPSSSQANQDKDTNNQNGGGTVMDYSKLNMPRESFLATIPRTYRHRTYAGTSHPLYYSQHHYNLRSSIYYSPFANRKFPPYQFWANSAQRDFHLSRIGVAGTGMMGRARGGILSMSGRESDGARVGSNSPLTVMGDLMLRPTMAYSSGTGSANSGGVNKAHYRSRLPVHLRHMTSRTNRRAAICVNPFQAGADGARRDGLPTSTSALTDSETSLDGSAHPGPASSSSSSKSTRADRRKNSGWKMVTTLDQDRDYPVLLRNTQGYPLIKLMRQDRAMPVAPASLSTSRLLSQHGGLANLIQTKQEAQPGSGSRSQGGPANGTNNVDRLIEEMNKWSV